MVIPRAIPCLLLRGNGFVKTVRFRDPTYLGDPVNIVRIFNDKEVDEVIVLDITATTERRPPRFDFVAGLASECFMPLCYGGGVSTVEEMRALFARGVEKVAVNTRAVETPELLRAAADAFGSQSIVVGIDVKRSWLGRRQVVTQAGRRGTGLDPVEHARRVEALGAGEILLTCVERDGTMDGYDLDLIRSVTSAVSIPVIAAGGAGRLEDLGAAVREGGAAAAAAGSLFVFQGRNRAVLVNYPEPAELRSLFGPTAAAAAAHSVQGTEGR
jgi:cyclase